MTNNRNIHIRTLIRTDAIHWNLYAAFTILNKYFISFVRTNSRLAKIYLANNIGIHVKNQSQKCSIRTFCRIHIATTFAIIWLELWKRASQIAEISCSYYTSNRCWRSIRFVKSLMPHPHYYSQIFDWLSRAALQTNNKSIGVDTRVRIGADAALDSLEPLCRIHIAADANSSWTILARLGARRKNCRISKLEDIWCQTIETSSSININHYTPRKTWKLIIF